MRKIPDTISDKAVVAQLEEIGKQIESKMKTVKTVKDSAQLQELKKISIEIDSLDQEWKKLAGI